MKTTTTKTTSVLVVALVAAFAVACGGTPKKSTNGKVTNGKDKPDDGKIDVGGGAEKIDRKVSKDAVKDFAKAVAFYKAKATEGWTGENCRAAGKKFANVASDHTKMVEARFNAGLAYHNCQLIDDAEKQYEEALKLHSSHAQSLSNLGEIAFTRGKVDQAKRQWEKAVAADSKLVAARNNLAWLLLQDLRATSNKTAWKNLEKQARDHLSSVLAVDNENVKAYVLYGLVYMEGSERNKNRLDLAKLLLDEAAKRDEKYPALYNARGLLFMRHKNLGLALATFQKAVALKPDFTEAHMNVGNITLGFRKYDTAAAEFSKVLELQPNNYDAHIGLGVAQRGLGDLDKAEASYLAARKIDAQKGAAHFNLGVLYKDFRANKATGLKDAQTAYKEARKNFRQFLSKPGATADDKKEAEVNVKDCDKLIKQLEDVMKLQAADNAGGNA